jgi:hypothetical protein
LIIQGSRSPPPSSCTACIMNLREPPSFCSALTPAFTATFFLLALRFVSLVGDTWLCWLLVYCAVRHADLRYVTHIPPT